MIRRMSESQDGFVALALEWLRCGFRKGLAEMVRVRGERRLELVETLALGGKRQLLLVQCDGQRVLVGTDGNGINSIVEMKDLAVTSFASSGMNERPQPKEKARCN